MANSKSIAILDCSGIMDPSKAVNHTEDFTKKLGDALRGIGFAYLINTGVNMRKVLEWVQWCVQFSWDNFINLDRSSVRSIQRIFRSTHWNQEKNAKATKSHVFSRICRSRWRIVSQLKYIALATGDYRNLFPKTQRIEPERNGIERILRFHRTYWKQWREILPPRSSWFQGCFRRSTKRVTSTHWNSVAMHCSLFGPGARRTVEEAHPFVWHDSANANCYAKFHVFTVEGNSKGQRRSHSMRWTLWLAYDYSSLSRQGWRFGGKYF